jgi:hypothetical protein
LFEQTINDIGIRSATGAQHASGLLICLCLAVAALFYSCYKRSSPLHHGDSQRTVVTRLLTPLYQVYVLGKNLERALSNAGHGPRPPGRALGDDGRMIIIIIIQNDGVVRPADMAPTLSEEEKQTMTMTITMRSSRIRIARSNESSVVTFVVNDDDDGNDADEYTDDDDNDIVVAILRDPTSSEDATVATSSFQNETC